MLINKKRAANGGPIIVLRSGNYDVALFSA